MKHALCWMVIAGLWAGCGPAENVAPVEGGPILVAEPLFQGEQIAFAHPESPSALLLYVERVEEEALAFRLEGADCDNPLEGVAAPVRDAAVGTDSLPQGRVMAVSRWSAEIDAACTLELRIDGAIERNYVWLRDSPQGCTPCTLPTLPLERDRDMH